MARSTANTFTERQRPQPAKKLQKYETLHDLLILKLRSLQDIEAQIEKALPKIIKAATDEKLREALSAHAEETSEHAERLVTALKILGDEAKGKSKVEAIRGLTDDASWIIKSIKNPAARDALVIAGMQYIEHYEIAGYGTACAWAEQMDHTEVHDLLKKTLSEEASANKKLNQIALERVNEKVESGMN